MTAPEPAEPAYRAFASIATGVHAVGREQASQIFHSPPADEQQSLVWIDISNPGQAEAEYLREELGFHPLAVEDCIRGRQRPKLDRYPGYFFLVIYAASVNPVRNRMALNELHVFLGRHYLVTVHDHRVQEVGEIVARWRSQTQQIRDVGGLAHLLLDVVVDDYFPIIEHFADRIEEVESGVFDQSADEAIPRILLLRHELMLFRKVVAPQRDVISTLLRRDLPFLRPELIPYFQDVHDHTIRVTEEIDSQRELLSALLDAHMSTSANQLNQTMRMMTAWSVILMSITLIAGIYGMNFVLMPELQWRWGYAFALALMAATGASLVLFFRRRGWL